MPSKQPVPNTMSGAQHARRALERINHLQDQRVELENVQLANDHESADPIPGLPPKMEGDTVIIEDGKPVFITYAERYAELDASMQRVWNGALERGIGDLVQAMATAEIARDEAQAKIEVLEAGVSD